MEVINQYNYYANNVFDCAINTQNNVYILHGTRSDFKNKENLPYFMNAKSHHDSYVADEDNIHLFSFTNKSIILNGLSNVRVVINNKTNHVLMRNCSNVVVLIKTGTISGIDIIKCKYIYVIMPSHNYTNIEYSENINLDASLDNSSQINILGSIDIFSNEQCLPANPFVNIIVTNFGIFPTKKQNQTKLFISN